MRGITLNGKWFWIAATMLLPIYILGQDHSIWKTDEAFVSEIGREMYVSGNYAVPTLNGDVFMEKPPLLYASSALCCKLFGRVSEGIIRIPSAIYALLGVLAVMLLAHRINGERMALWAGVVLSSNTIYFENAHLCSIDIALTAFISLCIFFFYRIYEKDKPSYSFLSVLPMYIFATMAFYAKGFLGVVLPGLTIVTFLVWMKDYKAMWRLKPWFGVVLFLLLTIPWFLELWWQGGSEYLRVFFIDNHLYRFVKTANSHLGHQGTHWYLYFEIIWKFFKPYSIFLIPASILFLRSEFRNNFSSPGLKLILSWFISEFAFLSISSTRREAYLLPVIPPAALAVAAWFNYRGAPVSNRIPDDAGHAWEKFSDWGFAVLMVALSVGLPIFCAIQEDGGNKWALTAILFTLALSVWAVYSLIKKNRERFYNLAMATAWALAVCSAIFIAGFSEYRDQSHFCRQVEQLAKDADVFYTLKPGEGEMGYIGFYTGKRIRDIKKEKNLNELAHSGMPVYAVMVAHKSEQIGEFENYVRERGTELKLLYSEPIPIRSRVSAIWRLVPAGSGKGGGV